jgi:hypothetical protein
VPRWGLVVRLVVCLAVVATTWAVGAAPAAAAGCTDPFTPAFRDAVAQNHPGQRVTASVYDARTACWYDLAPGLAMQTASVIKAQFLAGVLLRAQDQGRAVSTWESERIGPMMVVSHNPPASDLFVSLGGVAGQEQLDERFGLTATTSTSKWGATVSTARDRTLLALRLLHAGGPLSGSRRAEAWRSMSGVHPTQTWGITAGVPAGWSVALKNGFYPTAGTPRWRIGSSGFVRDDATGSGYAVTIMSDQNPDHETGQRLVELVAKQVNAVLTDGAPAARAVDRSQCVQTWSGETWTGVATRLGTTDAAGVRWASGGPTAPLAGMRACRPDLAPPPYDPPGPNAHYVRAMYRTFLGRTATEDETRHHATALDAGGSRLELARALATSREWLDREITAIYVLSLDRPPDASGLAYWRQQVAAGTSISAVGVHVFASNEFLQRSGGTWRGFVDQLYARLLGRASDDGGRTYWLEQLRRGATRASVAHAFYASVESRRDRVRRTYLEVLERRADPDGLAYWTDRLRFHDDVVLAAALSVSTEYFQKAQP